MKKTYFSPSIKMRTVMQENHLLEGSGNGGFQVDEKEKTNKYKIDGDIDTDNGEDESGAKGSWNFWDDDL